MTKLNFKQFLLKDSSINNYDNLTLHENNNLDALNSYCYNHDIDLGGFITDYGSPLLNKDDTINFIKSECDLLTDDPAESVPDYALIDFGIIGNEDDDTIFTLDGYNRVHVAKIADFNDLVNGLQDNYEDYQM